ncbi:hypothetical protein HYY73_00060 [Candidatus Woesearchaeota archaeon]|nr:hypothetical protein [Candidatus Woesearchaeota archaeon]
MPMQDTKSVIEAAKALLRQNRRTVAGYTFTIPSPREYRHQWLWDSCFHAIVLRHFDTAAAEEELRSLIASQHSDGMIPHESKFNILGKMLPITSRVTQPPFIARAALEVYEKSRNKQFLASIFPRLHRYHGWLEAQRETNGVLRVVDCNESGEDNSVVWDDEYVVPVHKTYMRWFPTYVPLFPQLAALRSVTATSVYADALECMAEIAGILGEKEPGNSYRKRNKAVVAAMPKAFRQKDGLYYSKTRRGKPIPYKTNSIFSPLFAAAITKKEARSLIEGHLLNEREFWTPYAIPTVAISEPKFSAEGYWRGPMWVNINWMLHRGLLRYGFKDAAQVLLQKTIAAIKKSGFREYYNPITGDGLGAKQFGWSALVADMILQK